MIERTFPAVDDLIRDVEGKAVELPRLVAIAAAAIKVAVANGADPQLLADVLADGIALSIAENVPSESKVEAAITALRLLTDRMLERGIV